MITKRKLLVCKAISELRLMKIKLYRLQKEQESAGIRKAQAAKPKVGE